MNLPVVSMRGRLAGNSSAYLWNYSPDVEAYYPIGYISKEMWDFTRPCDLLFLLLLLLPFNCAGSEKSGVFPL